jgi:hypothetical protein
MADPRALVEATIIDLFEALVPRKAPIKACLEARGLHARNFQQTASADPIGWTRFGFT